MLTIKQVAFLEVQMQLKHEFDTKARQALRAGMEFDELDALARELERVYSKKLEDAGKALFNDIFCLECQQVLLWLPKW